MKNSSTLFRAALEETARRGLRLPRDSSEPLWPAPYNVDSPDALKAFVFDCLRTWNEAEGEVQHIPAKAYLETYAELWWDSRSTGLPFICEKSRRLVISWLERGCTLWSMGVRKEDCVLAGLTYPKAAKHVWRVLHYYEDLRIRFTDWNLPACVKHGSTAAKQLDRIVLANGSKLEQINQDGDSFQGDGYSRVIIEELSMFRHVAALWAQAQFVTMGRPGTIGGHVISICNASPNPQWKELKGGTQPSANLGW